jgi:hypothetical protein
MGKILDRFRRNKKERKPTEEEVNAKLDAQGDASAKMPPPNQEQLQQLQQPTPKWSNYRSNNADKFSNNPTINNDKNDKTEISYGDETDDRHDDDYNLMVDGAPVYVVKQKRGYLSIFFSTAQTLILIVMIIQCKFAPISINREFSFSSVIRDT